MQAKIVSVEKKTIPQYSAVTLKDEPTLVVETQVHFYKDDGTLYLNQTFAQRPEDIDSENPQAYFDKQAAILQADLEGQAANKTNEANSELADQIVEKLMPSAPQQNGEETI
jgi:hypothetical protein